MGYQSGYVVQSNAPSKFCSTNGCGLGDKVSWPLEGSGIQNQIEESWVENFFAQSPAQMIHYELIFEEALLMEYLHECQKAGLNVRVIYLKHCDCSDAPRSRRNFWAAISSIRACLITPPCWKNAMMFCVRGCLHTSIPTGCLIHLPIYGNLLIGGEQM